MEKEKDFGGSYEMGHRSSLSVAHVVHIFQGSPKFNSSVLLSDNGIFLFQHQTLLLGKTQARMEMPFIISILVN